MAKKTIKKTKNKNSKKSKNKKNKKYSVLVLAVIIFLAFIYLITNYDKLFGEGGIAATVNGEEIFIKELNQQYNSLPEQYKLVYTKEMVLDQIINRRVLLQEADKQAITVTDSEVTEVIELLINQSELTKEEFISTLKEQGFDTTLTNKYYKEQLTISKLLNKTILSKIEVTDSEIVDYYESNKLQEQGYKLGEIKDQIEQAVFATQQEIALKTYLDQLRNQADVEVFVGEKEEEIQTTFESTNDEICKEDGKPAVYLFCIEKSTHCTWIKETFNTLMKEYLDDGLIAAYSWELSTGDNLLTETTETFIPKAHFAIFQKYNPESTVPAYVFGCKYVRIGNGYGSEDDLEAEKQEFVTIINQLLS